MPDSYRLKPHRSAYQLGRSEGVGETTPAFPPRHPGPGAPKEPFAQVSCPSFQRGMAPRPVSRSSWPSGLESWREATLALFSRPPSLMEGDEGVEPGPNRVTHYPYPPLTEAQGGSPVKEERKSPPPPRSSSCHSGA
ncbi:hypothetical protein EAI_15787 [Harpegnathos saltator]|uniref:Uncharacterized protein n=1 Tax=Harpegnathos saltator TaxID=610380 RepID=E2C2B8_HARSA|nr:hypothetical protein EAI_15787 [Harpegnathos saltator]